MLAGCSLTFGGDDGGGDDGCLETQGGDSNGLEAPAPELLNPETLRCESWYTGCDSRCGPCPDGDTRPAPTWAYCYSGCEGMDETQCHATTACRAVYDYACFTGDGPCTAEVPYIGCYGTDQTGPIQGVCVGLDAWTCSQHDDCIALHTPQCSGTDTSDCWQQFVECRDEATCYGEVLCDALPPNCPTGTTPGVKNGCWTGTCIPVGQCEPCPTTDCG